MEFDEDLVDVLQIRQRQRPEPFVLSSLDVHFQQDMLLGQAFIVYYVFQGLQLVVD